MIISHRRRVDDIDLKGPSITLSTQKLLTHYKLESDNGTTYATVTWNLYINISANETTKIIPQSPSLHVGSQHLYSTTMNTDSQRRIQELRNSLCSHQMIYDLFILDDAEHFVNDEDVFKCNIFMLSSIHFALHEKKAHEKNIPECAMKAREFYVEYILPNISERIQTMISILLKRAVQIAFSVAVKLAKNCPELQVDLQENIKLAQNNMMHSGFFSMIALHDSNQTNLPMFQGCDSQHTDEREKSKRHLDVYKYLEDSDLEDMCSHLSLALLQGREWLLRALNVRVGLLHSTECALCKCPLEEGIEYTRMCPTGAITCASTSCKCSCMHYSPFFNPTSLTLMSLVLSTAQIDEIRALCAQMTRRETSMAEFVDGIHKILDPAKLNIVISNISKVLDQMLDLIMEGFTSALSIELKKQDVLRSKLTSENGCAKREKDQDKKIKIQDGIIRKLQTQLQETERRLVRAENDTKCVQHELKQLKNAHKTMLRRERQERCAEMKLEKDHHIHECNLSAQMVSRTMSKDIQLLETEADAKAVCKYAEDVAVRTLWSNEVRALEVELQVAAAAAQKVAPKEAKNSKQDDEGTNEESLKKEKSSEVIKEETEDEDDKAKMRLKISRLNDAVRNFEERYRDAVHLNRELAKKDLAQQVACEVASLLQHDTVGRP